MILNLTDEDTNDDDPAGVIEIASGVSAFTGEGFVTLRWGTDAAQFTPDAARRHALAILECAEAAESDAAVFAFLRAKLKLEPDVAVHMIAALREHRGKSAGGV